MSLVGSDVPIISDSNDKSNKYARLVGLAIGLGYLMFDALLVRSEIINLRKNIGSPRLLVVQLLKA